MNIAFFASSLVSAYWNGAATYYRGMVSALHRRGHHVTFYESDAFDRQKHRDIPDPDYASVVVYPADNADELERCLDSAKGADLIVKASGNGVFDELLEAAVPELRTSHNRVAFWDVDAPATLDRLSQNIADPFRPLIPRYDLVLTYGGGPPVVKAYESFGAKLCVPIYNGLDPATHHPTQPEERFAADLSFLGNRLPDREARVEEFLFKPAQRFPDRQFLLGGSGWDSASGPSNVRRMGHVYTRDHNAFNCTPMAVLNINRQSMARNGYSPATRVFEAAGAGACVITDEFAGLGSFFEPGREILAAPDGEAVAELLASLTPARAREIGRAALNRALSHHTYDRRAFVLEGVLRAMGAPGAGVHSSGHTSHAELLSS
jgi:spore maturation protein CgeB